MEPTLSKDVSGRTVVFGIASKHDKYLTHATTVQTYAAEYQELGVKPVVVNLSEPDGPLNFLKALADPSCLGAHCEQGWGLQTKIPLNDQAVGVFEVTGKPAVAHIRDMPFYPWLRDTCFGPAPWACLSFADRASAELLQEVNPRNRSGPQVRFHSHVYFDLNPPITDTDNWHDRPIRCLYAGSYQNPARFREELKETYPQFDVPLQAAFESATTDFYDPIWKHGRAALEAEGSWTNYMDRGVTNFLGTLNQMVRMERRRILLGMLAKHPIHLIWSGERPDVDLHPDTVLLEPSTFPETVALMGQSQSMVMSLNSFSAALSERLLTAMRQRAVVLTYPNQLIEETFIEGEHLLTFDAKQEALDSAMANLDEPATVQEIHTTAVERIEEHFHCRHIVRDHLQMMIDYEPAVTG